MENIRDLKQRRNNLWRQMKDLLKDADREQRDLTPGEEGQYEAMEEKVEELSRKINGAKDVESRLKGIDMNLDDDNKIEKKAIKQDIWEGSRSSEKSDGIRMKDANGQEVRVIGPGDSWMRQDVSLPNGERLQDCSLGKVVRAMLAKEYIRDLNDTETLTYRHYRGDPATRAQSIGEDTKGGVLQQNVLFNQMIQASREEMALYRAGCKFIDMPTNSVDLCGISTDAVAYWTAENAALTESDVDFQAIQLRAKKAGTYVKMSVELAHSTNAVEAINDSLKYAVIKCLDSALLTGSGGDEPTGLSLTSGINTATLSAALTADQLITYFYVLRTNNCPTPISAIYNNDLAESMSKWKDGEGAYILSKPGGTPDIWGKMRFIETGQIATTTNATDLYLLNASHVYVGLRPEKFDLLIAKEVFMANAQYGIRILLEGDCGTSHANWVYFIDSISV